mgnify:CR=1 FL=1
MMKIERACKQLFLVKLILPFEIEMNPHVILERIMIRKRFATIGPRASVILDLVKATHVALIARDWHHLTASINGTLAYALVAKLFMIEQVLGLRKGKTGGLL